MVGRRLTLELLEDHDPNAPQTGRERRFLCPLEPCSGHQDPRRHRNLSLNAETGAWFCHRCGTGGTLAQEENRHRQPMERRARQRVRAKAVFEVRALVPSTDDLARRIDTMPGSPIDQAPDALDYLLQRGITKETAMSCGVCYEAQWRLGGESRRAVLFPVTDAEGGLVAVHGRYVDGGTPKSRTSGPKSQGMFATPGALAAPVFAVTEAPLDALALAQLQKLPAMALIGTSWPTWLRRHVLGRTVLLATDNDAAGDACATTLESELQSFGARAKRFRAPYPAKDWNEALDHTRMHWTAAPRREDFPEDSAAWTALLRSTYERPERPAKGIDELLAALHTARCFGTRLDYDGHRWRLVPRDPGDPVVDVDIEYGQLRERYLMPHAAKIKEILAGLATPDGLTVDPSLS